jgi:hypothetical protein
VVVVAMVAVVQVDTAQTQVYLALAELITRLQLVQVELAQHHQHKAALQLSAQ